MQRGGFLKRFYSLTFSGSKTQLYDGFSGKDFIFRKLFKAIGQGRFMCLRKDFGQEMCGKLPTRCASPDGGSDPTDEPIQIQLEDSILLVKVDTHRL